MATSKTTHVQTLILGGGITGLTTAYALEKQGQANYLLVEAKGHLGGLCATTFLNGYHFDYGGHFLHLHTPLGQTLVKELLATNLTQHKRHAFIYTNGMRVPFPFQTNLWALHPELRALCLEELETLQDAPQPPRHFEQWCLQSFGRGLYEAFFRPYNEKLWGRHPSAISADWGAQRVKGLSISAVLKDLVQRILHTKPAKKETSLIEEFYYPKYGPGQLWSAVAKRIEKQGGKVLFNSRVTGFAQQGNQLTSVVCNGQEIPADIVISSMPLKDLVAGLPQATPAAKRIVSKHHPGLLDLCARYRRKNGTHPNF